MAEFKQVDYVSKEGSNGNIYDFFPVDELPTGGSQYNYTLPDKKIYIRGLRIGEAKALSRIISSDIEPTISELLSVYSAVIIGIDVWELTQVDFMALITLSNLYTQSKSGWEVTEKCPYDDCGKITSKVVTLFDLEFSEPKYDSLPIIKELSNSDKVTFIIPSLKAIMEYELVRENDGIDQDIMSFCPEIESINGNYDMTILEKYNYLYDLSQSDFKIVESVDDSMEITILPVKMKCNHCKKEFDIEFSLTYQKAIPLPRL